MKIGYRAWHCKHSPFPVWHLWCDCILTVIKCQPSSLGLTPLLDWWDYTAASTLLLTKPKATQCHQTSQQRWGLQKDLRFCLLGISTLFFGNSSFFKEKGFTLHMLTLISHSQHPDIMWNHHLYPSQIIKIIHLGMQAGNQKGQKCSHHNTKTIIDNKGR